MLIYGLTKHTTNLYILLWLVVIKISVKAQSQGAITCIEPKTINVDLCNMLAGALAIGTAVKCWNCEDSGASDKINTEASPIAKAESESLKLA